METSEVSASPAPSQSTGRRIVQALGQAWAWLFLLILLVFFSLTGEGFLSAFNLQSILANTAIMLIMALGQTFVILSAGIDLSTGYVMGMASVVGAMVMSSLAETLPIPLAILIGMAAGLGSGVAAGLVNGLIISRLNVPPFIATLGMFSIARGIGFVLSGGMPRPIFIERLSSTTNNWHMSISAKDRCWNSTTSNLLKVRGRRRLTGMHWAMLENATPATTSTTVGRARKWSAVAPLLNKRCQG